MEDFYRTDHNCKQRNMPIRVLLRFPLMQVLRFEGGHTHTHTHTHTHKEIPDKTNFKCMTTMNLIKDLYVNTYKYAIGI